MPQHVVRRQWQVNDGQTICIKRWQVIHMHRQEHKLHFNCTQTSALQHDRKIGSCFCEHGQMPTYWTAYNKYIIWIYWCMVQSPTISGLPFEQLLTTGVIWLSKNTISFGFFVQLVTSMVLPLSSAELGDLGDRDGALGWMMPMRRATLKTD